MPTTLAAGDIAFSAYQSENIGGTFNGDAFEFVLLVPVTTGTIVYFTDNGFRTDTSTFRTNEGVLRWTAQADLPAGTIVTYLGNSGSPTAVQPANTAEWTAIDGATGAVIALSTFSLAAAGDSIHAFQSPLFGGADLLGGTAIAALSVGGPDGFEAVHTTASSGAETGLATGLTDGVDAVSLTGAANARYDETAAGSIEIGTAAQIRASLNNDTFWLARFTTGSPGANGVFNPGGHTAGTFAIGAALPTVSINSVSGPESTSATFTVSLSAASTETVTINYATAGGTATSGTDFTAASGTVTFLPGETDKPVTVNITDDGVYEGSEDFTVVLSAATNATIATGTGTGTINASDTPPEFNFSSSSYSIAEGNAGTALMTFTVTKTGATELASSVNYATSNGTAAAGSDYVATSGTLNFAAGETSQTFTVTINGDTTVEPNENFTISLNTPSNATLGATSTATGTITNDDNAPPTATNLSAAESYTEDTPRDLTDIVITDTDSANVTATLTLSNPAAGSLSTTTSGVVTSTYVAGTGVWTASGALADVNALLAGVSFNPATNFNGNFNIATSVSDGVASPITGTKVFTGTPVNDAPAGTSATLTINEDGQHRFTASDFGFSDLSDSPANTLLAVTITSLPTTGTLRLNGFGLSPGQVVSAANLPNLVYTPGPNGNGANYASFTFQVQDNGGTASGGVDLDASANTLTFSVTAINDAPTLTGVATTLAVVENAAPTLIDSNVTFSDPDNNFNGGTLSLSGLLGQDRAAILNTGTGVGQIGVSGTDVTYGGVVIGTFSGGVGTTLTVTLNGSATSVAVDALIQNLTYANASEAPTASRTLTLNVTDASGVSIPGGFSSSAGSVAAIDVGDRSTPTFADYNSDGRVDLIIGGNSGGFGGINVFQRQADGSLVQQTGSANPFNGINFGNLPAPAFADFTGDGSIDALIARDNGAFRAFAGNGAGGFTELTGGANPFAAFAGSFDGTPAFPDFDNDGDQDLVVGTFGGNFRAFSNTSNVFTELSGAANPFNALSAGSTHAKPAFFDIDRDGDLDLISGRLDGAFAVFRNDGVGQPYVALTGTANPLNGFAVSSSFSAPVFGDVTNDGLADLISGRGDGTLTTVAGTPGIAITVGVTSVNDAPSGTDAIITLNEDTSRSFTASDFGFSDVDGNALTAVRISSLPTAGTLRFNGNAVSIGDLIPVGSLSSLVFTPALNANGTGYSSFTFQVQDNGGTANSGVDLDPSANTLTFDVTAVNDAPTATDLSAAESYSEDTPLNLTDIVITDIDSANVTATLTLSNAAAGTLTTGTSNSVTSTFVGGVWTASGAVADVNALLAGVTFNPAANFFGSFNITTSVSDGVAAALTGVKAFTGTSVNDAPSGSDATLTILEDTPRSFTAADFGFSDVSDSPANALLGVVITTLPTAGTLTLDGFGLSVGQVVPVADIPDLVFTPALNANGTGYATFTFQVQDNGGTADSGVDLDPSANTLTFNVTSVNDAPAGTNANQSVVEGTSRVLTLADFGFTDVDGNNFAAIRVSALPGAGRLTFDADGTGPGAPVSATVGQIVTVADIMAGRLAYETPSGANNGATNFSFQVQDDGGTLNGGVDLDASANTITYTITPATPPGPPPPVTIGNTTYVSGDYVQPANDPATVITPRNQSDNIALNITGNAGTQTIIGNYGPNILTGGGGADTLIGLINNDTYIVSNSNTVVVENRSEGTDTVLTSVSYILPSDAEIEFLQALNATGTDPIFLTGNAGNQRITGNAGDNIINGLGGSDTMVGLGGNDTYLVRGPGDVVVENNAGGFDTVYTTVSYNLGDNEVEVLSTVTQTDTTPINLIGNFVSQYVVGNYGDNLLNGGSGVDTLIGLFGNDLYAVGDSRIVIIEADGQGTDTVVTSVNYALGADVSVEVLSAQIRSSTVGLSLTGNRFAQTIAATEGADTINGGAGSDVLIGGGGADRFDFTTLLGSSNVDAITDFGAGDRIGLSSAIFGAIGASLDAGEFVIGTAAADANDSIVYDQATGQLYYDADGSGGAAAVLFAIVTPGTILSSANFEVIAP